MEGNTHTVYFLDEAGQLLCTQRVAHGAAAEPPAYQAPAGCEFQQWSRSVARIIEDTYCVAVCRRRAQQCRVHVLDLRGALQLGSTLFPLGNWAAGEALTRADLDCLHLRRTQALPPFRLRVQCDTLLVLTGMGVRAFDHAMHPLELEGAPLQLLRREA